MLRLKSLIWYLVLLSLAFPLGNVWAKKPKSDEAVVSGITLDVMRIEACARKKRCTVASGPMQLDLLELADGKVDFANQVLLPERTRELRLVLGENNTITVDGESFPLTVPSGQTSGLKLKGRKAFGKEGGFLSGLTLDLNLRKQLVVQAKKVRHKEKGRHGKKKVSYVYSYKLKPVIKVATAEVAPLTEDNIAAVVAMPNEENEIKIGESFSLVIPAGAVATPMVISVKETKYTVEVMDEDTGEVVEKPALSSNYELSPDGAEFDEPLVVTLPYSPETLPSEVSEYDLAVYLDAEKIPTDINTMSKTATADVWHFTNVTVSSPQATGNFVFPFDNERNDVWQLCQGYNTPKISHGSATYPNLIHAFDFAYGTGNLGATGCWAKEWGKNDYASEDKTVVAPADGIIIKNSGDITVFQLKVPVSNGHGKQIKCIRLGHIKSNSARMKADPKIELAQGTLIGKLSSPTVSAGKYAHLHMAAYATTNCTGVTVPFGTVFGSGYPDFSSNGSKHQWHGTEIPAGGSQPTTCPNGDGLYCGGAVSRDMNTLYRCTDGVYSVEEQCSDGCQTMSSGTNDQCRQVQASCPSGNGLYCGGTVSRDANTLYRCTDGVYSVEEQCSDGCQTMSSGTNDQCRQVQASCPSGNGLYCGGTVSRDANTLYRCTDGVYSVEEQCSDGCQTMSSGTNDQCRQVQASCPSGNGLYCGGTVSRDANTLYRCTDGVYSVEEQCSDGCQTMSSGTNDQCRQVQASCPSGNGLYCGGTVSRDANTLYRCTDGVYSVEEQCSDGCQTMSSGTNDQCRQVQASCPSGNGLYCGGTVSRDANTLYRCTDGVYSVEEQCSDGCQTMSSGTNDQCRQVQASCPSGNGLYCGGTVSRDANTLYRCTDGVYSVEEQCSDGCETMPSGTNDQCKDVVLSVVNSITPSNTTLDSLTVFTVLGTDLPSTLAFWIEECENVTYVGGNSAAQQFSCTPRWTIGTKNGVIKDNVGGNVLYNFTVNVSAATPGTCTSGPQTMVWQGLEWQRCDDNWAYTYEAAIDYCEGLILDGYSDWRLPTKDELKSLVVCSNGTPTPLADDYGTPSHCGDGNSAPYNKPTIDSSFVGQINSYWSSTEYNATAAWEVNFGSGWSHHTMPKLVQNAVRCVR